MPDWSTGLNFVKPYYVYCSQRVLYLVELNNPFYTRIKWAPKVRQIKEIYQEVPSANQISSHLSKNGINWFPFYVLTVQEWYPLITLLFGFTFPLCAHRRRETWISVVSRKDIKSPVAFSEARDSMIQCWAGLIHVCKAWEQPPRC